MNLTAVFESWHLGDGNYPPLRRGQQVNLSFEIYPFETARGDANHSDSFTHLGGGSYEFKGSILRAYDDDPQEVVMIVQSGDFRFYINRPLGLKLGDPVVGRGTLMFDHYLWVEFLDHYPDPPDLFFQLVVHRIRRVQIPERFVTRHERGKSFPASLSPTEYGEKDVTEIETMEGQSFEEAFCLVDLTQEGVSGSIPRTFV
ncbi:MAG TPA: hypothetical protein VKU01_06335 [Bryobacteraceae bacterium]|nr:hypothetical protein [Bryobacteraceae bacterium]